MSILIALPCYGGVLSAKTALGLFELGKQLVQNNIEHQILFVSNQSLIPLARSDIANYFLNETNFSHLMWIDSDIGFEPNDIFKLIDLDVEHAMATYRHKVQHPQYSFTLDTKDNAIQWNNTKTACKIKRNVGGFSLIHRNVFDILIKLHLVDRYIPTSNSREISNREYNNSYHFYDTPIDNNTGMILPEDFAFHDKCYEAGIDMWLRTDIQLIHNGNTDFVGHDLDSLLKGE